jgi:hypothetical protein
MTSTKPQPAAETEFLSLWDDNALTNRIAAIGRMVTTRGRNISELQAEIATLTAEKHGLIRERVRRLNAQLPSDGTGPVE